MNSCAYGARYLQLASHVVVIAGSILSWVAPLLAQDFESPRWALEAEPVLSFSEFSSASGATVPLFQVVDLELLPDGAIAIANGGEAVLHVLDGDGHGVWQSGGPGEGPGEFLAISWVQATASQLVAYDPVLRRLSWFDLWTGTALRDTAFSVPTRGNAAPPEPVGLLQGGQVVAGSRMFPSGPVEGLFRPTVVLERITDGGEVRDSLGSYSGDEYLIVQGVIATPPYQRLTQFAVFENRVAVAIGERLEVEVFGTDSTGRRVYTDELWTPLTGESLSSHDLVTRNTYPGVVGVEYDDRGRLWVSSPTELAGGEVGYAWRVLNARLEIVGTLTVPAEVRIQSIRGDRVAVIRIDELDVEHLEVYRMAAPGELSGSE